MWDDRKYSLPPNVVPDYLKCMDALVSFNPSRYANPFSTPAYLI